MSDIFISYKREEQPLARRLADALERLGWDVWWDPKLRAGEHFDDVIEQALMQSRCVVVLWSRLSVKSRYVKDEASYALRRDKLVPVAVEAVDLPFRFEGVQTAQLLDWDGSDTPAFRKLVSDIENVTGSPKSSKRPQPPGAGAKTRTPGEQPPSSPAPAPGSVFTDTLQDGSQGPEMVVIPMGSFQMGSPASEDGRWDGEGPQHPVSIAKPFAMGQYPVTFEEYDRYADATGRDLPGDQGWGRERRPVINVLWEDAMAYCEWLATQTGKRYRLPTEAEWEYAARAGTETPYWWGNDIGRNRANCDGCGSQWDGKQTAPVGSFEPNPFGLYDMHGNVWERVQDCWHENYENAPADQMAWPEKAGGDCGRRVVRGGSWDGAPGDLRSAYRGRDYSASRDIALGFRLAQDL